MVEMDRLEDLTETERMIRGTVDELAEDYGEEYMRECREDDRMPTELWDELADLGILGMNVPEEYGGQGMDMKEMAILTERLCYRGMNVLYLLISATMGPIPIKKHGSEELKERFLTKIPDGDLRLCFAITEAEAGTNSARIKTLADRDGDRYVVNGEKYFITGVETADYIQLIARTTPYEEVRDTNPYDGVSILLVPTDAPGLEYDKLDLELEEPLDQFAVHFDDVPVPVENRVGEEGDGFLHMFDALNPERIFGAASAVGGGNRILEKAVDHANEREVFEGPIGAYQSVQHPLAEAKIQLELTWLATLKTAEAFDEGHGDVGAYANMINYASSEANWDAVDAAIQPFGGRAFLPENGLIDSLVGARLARIAPINNEMVLNNVAENTLGLPSSY